MVSLILLVPVFLIWGVPCHFIIFMEAPDPCQGVGSDPCHGGQPELGFLGKTPKTMRNLRVQMQKHSFFRCSFNPNA